MTTENKITSVKIDGLTLSRLHKMQRKLSFVNGISLSLRQVINRGLDAIENEQKTDESEPEAVHA